MSSDDDNDSKELHSGYHGWMKTIAKTSQDFTPVRIEDSAVVVAVDRSSDSRSAWNSAGTWEERDKSGWARERLKHHILTSFSFDDEAEGLGVKATSIVRCDGEAKVVFSRGKKRCGYDLSVKFAWASGDVSGHVELHDFDDTSADEFEIIVTADGSSQSEVAAKKAVIDKEPELRKLLALWKEELLQQ
uniref:Activator of Hsp90 ATPase AHSA1-like N-terminal domain-containing protein n=1 Tax=Hyaloperonospora arabidopsidis (strain Emoy2) TaxID=559515 RepID=M4BD12_HYAAE